MLVSLVVGLGVFDGDLIYVPASWNEQNPDWDGYGGVAWYQYDFHVPREFSGLTAWLVFEGAGYLTRVWFNGLSIGGHEGSFTQFRLKVNGVRFGDWNRVVVKVDNNSKPPRRIGTLRIRPLALVMQ